MPGATGCGMVVPGMQVAAGQVEVDTDTVVVVADTTAITTTGDEVATADEEAKVVAVPAAVDVVAFETPLPVTGEPPPVSELTAARVRGPKNPVAGRACVAWN